MALAIFGIDLKTASQELVLSSAKPPDDTVPKPNFLDDPYYIVLPIDEPFYPTVENANKVKLMQNNQIVDRSICSGMVTCHATNLGGTTLRNYYVVRSNYNLVTYFKHFNSEHCICRSSDPISQSLRYLSVFSTSTDITFSISYPDTKNEAFIRRVEETISINVSGNLALFNNIEELPDENVNSRQIVKDGRTITLYRVVPSYELGISIVHYSYQTSTTPGVIEEHLQYLVDFSTTTPRPGYVIWKSVDRIVDMATKNVTFKSVTFVNDTRLVSYLRTENFSGKNFSGFAIFNEHFLIFKDGSDLRVVISDTVLAVVESSSIKAKRNDVTWSIKDGFSDQITRVFSDDVDVNFDTHQITARFDQILGMMIVKYDGQIIALDNIYCFSRIIVNVWPALDVVDSGTRVKTLDIIKST